MQTGMELQSRIELMVETMPAFPRSVHKVLELTSSINCAPKDVVEAIEHDPVMTAKMLKMVNSAFYSLPKKITSMKHAVVYIGINTVKNLALSIATVGMLPKHNQAGFDMQAFLLHSLVTGSIARRLAEHVDRQGHDGIDFFVAGLLHDFGKVVLVNSEPVGFKEALAKAATECVPLHIAEAELLGLNHCQVGAVLGEKWQFPEALIQAIREHHQPESESNVLRDCVLVANQLCKYKEVGNSGSAQLDSIPQNILSQLGADLDTILEKVGSMEDLIEEANLFANL